VLIANSTTAVLEYLLSNNRMLDPHDHFLEFWVDLQLHHSSLDTSKLTPEESARRIFSRITPSEEIK
jgi:hypothetical protein